jgi:hypothetical protein
MKRRLTADELIQEMGECLAESSGENIALVANTVLTGTVTYIEDSVFEIETVDDDEFQCPACKGIFDIEDSVAAADDLYCADCAEVIHEARY